MFIIKTRTSWRSWFKIAVIPAHGASVREIAGKEFWVDRFGCSRIVADTFDVSGVLDTFSVSIREI